MIRRRLQGAGPLRRPQRAARVPVESKPGIGLHATV